MVRFGHQSGIDVYEKVNQPEPPCDSGQKAQGVEMIQAPSGEARRHG